MSFLQSKWSEHEGETHPARRYANQCEFEASWIYTLRRRYRVSQESLAVMANVSVTTVQNWENPRSAKAIADHNQSRQRLGSKLMHACERLFQRDQQPAYLWKALEVACRAPLQNQDMFRLAHALFKLQGHAHVQHRVMSESNFDAARVMFDHASTLN